MTKLLFVVISVALFSYGADDKIKSFLSSNSELIKEAPFKKDQHWAAMGRLRFKAESYSDLGLAYAGNNSKSLQLYLFVYPDSEGALDALGNLLSCFPPKCEDIDWRKDSEGEYLPAIYIVNQNRIYSIKINCSDVDDRWDKLASRAIEHFSGDSSVVLRTTCDQLIWN